LYSSAYASAASVIDLAAKYKIIPRAMDARDFIAEK